LCKDVKSEGRPYWLVRTLNKVKEKEPEKGKVEIK
jgi:hypothetical protein